MSTNDSSIDLENPGFTRGMLAAAEQAVITDAFAHHVSAVLDTVNDGKEATVYLCQGRDGEELLAAKIYRARRFRAFANESQYLDLEAVRDKRLRKAIKQRSKKGKRVSHHMWIDREWQALKVLYEYGASVPKPWAHCSAGILMEYIGDADGAAPMLVHTRLSSEATARAFEAVINDVRTLLDCELIHGDLSAYNILYHQDRPRLIDLPQASDIKSLADPWPMFYRDIANLCQHFERQGLARDPLTLALDLWKG
jgi:RIO kinase 1